MSKLSTIPPVTGRWVLLLHHGRERLQRPGVDGLRDERGDVRGADHPPHRPLPLLHDPGERQHLLRLLPPGAEHLHPWILRQDPPPGLHLRPLVRGPELRSGIL